jgi:SAM-dependent methyltransferase
MTEAPLFILDSPQYHDIGGPGVYRIRGAALAIDGPVLESLVIRRDSAVVAQSNIDRPCPELAQLNIAGAATSRFEVHAFIDPSAEYEISVDDSERLFVIHAPLDSARLHEIAATVSRFPSPPADLVQTTQGGGDVKSYIASAVSGFQTLESVLRQSGHEPSKIGAILDVGCGTGRLLLGWHAAGKHALVGVDINPTLIDWNRGALPDVAEWRVSSVTPPLDLDAASFDLIQLASVFTHLPLPLQRAWVTELRRLLRPDGCAVITLHGSLYARVLLDPASQETFAKDGYVEVAGAEPGANAFATFHSHAFAEQLFAGFKSVRWYPRGNDPDLPSLFPIAALQDVYVLEC